MTTLYKPVLIESAEQASTLPRDVLIYDAEQGQVYVDAPPGHAYEGEFVDIDGDVTFADDLIGCTALVPIEAKEESGAKGDGEAEDFYFVRRYVTPWEAE